jgi:hypothetical protein
VIGQALTRLEPVNLFATQARATFAENRRKPPGPVDHDVPVLLAKTGDGEVRAVMFSYACHNLTLPPTFVQYCSEYSGVARDVLKRKYLTAEALFLSGAGADIDPRKQVRAPGQERHATFAYGRELGEAIDLAIRSELIPIAAQLRVAYTETPLDFEPLPSREELQSQLNSQDHPVARKARYILAALDAGRDLPTSYPCPLQAVRFGNELLLIALSAEPVIQFALDFKKQYGPGLVWVAGYCNDMFGYIATEKIQQEGGYEGGRAMLWSALPGPYTRDTERRIRAGVDDLVQRVSP